jgi:hypothetical protein
LFNNNNLKELFFFKKNSLKYKHQNFVNNKILKHFFYIINRIEEKIKQITLNSKKEVVLKQLNNLKNLLINLVMKNNIEKKVKTAILFSTQELHAFKQDY